MGKKLKYFKQCLFGLWLFWALPCNAQNYTQWRFPNNGIFDFTKGPSLKYVETQEGGRGSFSTMSDTNGRLLFFQGYTYINNREGHIMWPQIYGVSNYRYRGYEQQTSAAFLMPGSKTRYALVYSTIDTKFQDSSFDLYQIVIDAALDSGKGGIESGKIFYTGRCNKLTAIRHSNGKDYWILARISDTLFSFPFTASGIGKPKKYIFPVSYKLGNLKASADGKLLLECDNDWWKGKLYNYSFNPTNGVISDRHEIDNFTGTQGKEKIAVHDITFSPNDSLFYVIDIVYHNATKRNIIQYERFNPDISESKNILTVPVNAKGYLYFKWCSGIQLGPDGKIYFIENVRSKNTERHPFLGVITDPNKKGVQCSIKSQFLDIATGASWDSILTSLPFVLHDGRFPKFSNEYFCDWTRDTSVIKFSYGVNFENESHPDFTNFVWYFGDGDSLIETIQTSTAHFYTNPGSYLVRLKAITADGYIAWYSDSVTVKPFGMRFKAKDSITCQYVNTQFLVQVTMDSTEKTSNYSLEFGDGTESAGILATGIENSIYHVYKTPGIYNIRLNLDNRWGCFVIQQEKAITVITAPKPGFSLSSYSGCAPLSIALTNQSSGDIIDTWYTVNDTPVTQTDTLTFPKSGIYKVKQYLLGKTGCITSDSAYVVVKKGFSLSDKVRIANVTIEKNKVNVAWYKMPNTKQYSIFRRKTEDTALYYLNAAADTTYSDSSINPSSSSWTYYIVAIDSCGRTSDTSGPGQTILLKATELDSAYMSLAWNMPMLWEQGIDKFNIEYHGDAGAWQSIVLQNSTGYMHKDFAQSLQLRACYRVIANEKAGNAQSLSNELCVPLNPRLWIPNAFTPNGDNLNDIFKVDGIGISDIVMTVVCRDRGRVFTTIPGTTFWDGNLWKNNQPVKAMPPGVYLYFIQAKGKDGWIYKSGLVHLLR